MSITLDPVRRRVRARRSPELQLPPPVPVPPDGWVIGPPDFVGVGFMKCGTSWWYRLLAAHPQVADPAGRGKEIHFFDQFCTAPFGDEVASSYARWFPRPPGSIAGEWTPRYAYDYWAPPMLAAAAPDVKLLVMVRDPLKRYVSGLTHDLSRGRPMTPNLAQQHLGRGLYHQQLQRVWDAFPPERVLVLQYERCVSSPKDELDRTCDFLELDRVETLPETARRVVNQTSSAKPTVPPRTLEALVAAYRDDVERLAAAVPHLDLDRWPAFGTPPGSHG